MVASAPPPELGGFPRTTISTGDSVYRIVAHRDDAGRVRSGWYFSSLPSDQAGRYDLPRPRGSCYFSDRRHGAWLEVFRASVIVDRRDVERRRLFTASRTGVGVDLANLRSPAARRFGVTADLSAGDDYAVPQRWALALYRVGLAGVSSTVRHDPSLRARTIAIFGRAGSRSRVVGWQGGFMEILHDLELLRTLQTFGVAVLDPPYDVDIDFPMVEAQPDE